MFRRTDGRYRQGARIGRKHREIERIRTTGRGPSQGNGRLIVTDGNRRFNASPAASVKSNTDC